MAGLSDYLTMEAKFLSEANACANEPAAPFTSAALSWTPPQPCATVLSWAHHGHCGTSVEASSVDHLLQMPPAPLRIILLPIDSCEARTASPLIQVLQAFRVPPAFLSERLREVAYSFGRRDDHNMQLTWFHYLSKSLKPGPLIPTLSAESIPKLPSRPTNQTRRILGRLRTRNNRLDVQQEMDLYTDASKQSHADFTWVKSSFILQVIPGASKSASNSVTLLCFGASNQLQARLESLRQQASWPWERILDDPYSILSVVFDELYTPMDKAIWRLGDMFGAMETYTLNTSARDPKHLAREIDFVGLYNIHKQAIFFQESTSSFLQILGGLLATYPGDQAARQQPSHQLLTYQRSAVHAIQTRLNSLDKRISNLTALSFNLVAQSDSQTLKVDSKLMILIALVTMVFLPTNTIASIFSGPFFDAKFAVNNAVASDQLHTLAQFWLFWAISLPVTLVILGFGWWYWQYIKREVLNPRKVHHR